MLLNGVPALAEGLSEQQRLGVVAALLGILVFGVIVLVAERRNHGHESLPPGRVAAGSAVDPPRNVYRPPASSVPILSAREAAGSEEPASPYPVPFQREAEPATEAHPTDSD